MPLRLRVFLIFLVASALQVPVPAALANGTPVRVVLGYMSGVSNWGPTDAAGVAELVFQEGEVRLSVVGLPRLSEGAYNIWLLRTADGRSYNLGRFNTGPDRTARLDYVLPEPIPEEHWDLMLISVEDGTPPVPGPRRSIAGRVEPPEGRGPLPAELPRTGGEAALGPPAVVSSPATTPGPAVLGPALGFGAGVLATLALGRIIDRLRRPR
ncbi:MAG: hypothetical protein C4315_08120 [Chloroflexota bacterium]